MKNHVRIHGRHFVVVADAAGPRIIKERKLYAPGTYMECWTQPTIWHRDHHAVSRFLITDIIEKWKTQNG